MALYHDPVFLRFPEQHTASTSPRLPSLHTSLGFWTSFLLHPPVLWWFLSMHSLQPTLFAFFVSSLAQAGATENSLSIFKASKKRFNDSSLQCTHERVHRWCRWYFLSSPHLISTTLKCSPSPHMIPNSHKYLTIVRSCHGIATPWSRLSRETSSSMETTGTPVQVSFRIWTYMVTSVEFWIKSFHRVYFVAKLLSSWTFSWFHESSRGYAEGRTSIMEFLTSVTLRHSFVEA